MKDLKEKIYKAIALYVGKSLAQEKSIDSHTENFVSDTGMKIGAYLPSDSIKSDGSWSGTGYAVMKAWGVEASVLIGNLGIELELKYTINEDHDRAQISFDANRWIDEVIKALEGDAIERDKPRTIEDFAIAAAPIEDPKPEEDQPQDAAAPEDHRLTAEYVKGERDSLKGVVQLLLGGRSIHIGKKGGRMQ